MSRGPQFRVVNDDDLAAYCWCSAQVVWVPRELVQRCETLSCGAPRCQAPDPNPAA